VWNCLIFFVGEYSSVWPEICHILSRIQWIFLCGISGKNYFGRIFQKFSRKPRLSTVATCEISSYLLQFLFYVRIALKKFTQVLSYIVFTQVRRHVHERIDKRIYEEENPGRFVFGKPVLFTLGLGLTTPYSLGVLVWNHYQMFLTMSINFWLRFEPQIRPTRLGIRFLFITARAERKVRSCVKLFDFFREWILICLTWNLSCFVPNSVEIVTWNFKKKLFRRIFQKFSRKPRLPTLFCVCIALKKFPQLLSYVVCNQVRRHVHKRITKRRYGEEKAGRFVFGKPVLFTLGLTLTTPNPLGVLVWNLYQTFVTVSIEFWLRYETQIRPTRLAISFLLVTVRAERKVHLCVKLFDFFRGWKLIRLTWNLSCFVPNSVEILTWNFRKKYFERICQKISRKPRLSTTETFEISL